MNNNNFEFKSYIPTPTDQYMLGIAKVKLYGKIVVNFKHVKTKDGSGTFFCTNNYSMTDASGEKKYLSCVMLDSRDDEEALMEYIRSSVNQVLAQRSVHQGQQIAQMAQPGTYYPHGGAIQKTPDFNYPTQAAQTSEVANQEQLPF
jgi:hypothetical protein